MMSTCNQCGNSNREDAKFCEQCGSPLSENIPERGRSDGKEDSSDKEILPETKENRSALPEEFPIHPAETKPHKKGKKSLIGFLIALGLISIVGVFLVSKFVFGFFGPSPGKNFALYVKGNKAYFNDFSKKDPVVFSSRHLLGKSSSYLYRMLSDGKTLLYPEKFDSSDYTYSLFLKDVTKEDAEEKKIDSNISQYTVNKDNTLITYMKYKGNSGTLYQKSLKDPDGEAEAIAKNIFLYHISEDGKKLSYLKKENLGSSEESKVSLYFKKDVANEDEDPLRLEKGIYNTLYHAPDLSFIYYIKNGKLIKRNTDKEEGEVIAQDVTKGIIAYKTGEAYYLKETGQKESLYSLITDDLKEADDRIKDIPEPEYVSYPSKWSYVKSFEPSEPHYYDFFKEYYYNFKYYKSRKKAYAEYKKDRKAYEKEMAAYDEALKKYEEYEKQHKLYLDNISVMNEKQSRDALREELKKIDVTALSLYYYDGKEEHKLSDSVLSRDDVSLLGGTPAVSFTPLEKDGLKSFSFSTLVQDNPYYDYYNHILEKSNLARKTSVAVNRFVFSPEQEDASSFSINSTGKTLYFLADKEGENGVSTLYKAEISDTGIAKPEKVEEVHSFRMTSKDDLIFFKEVNDLSGDFYLNGKKVDEDVSITSVQKDAENGRVYYQKDRTEKDGKGTLMVWNPDKKVKISEDISDYLPLPDGRVAYLKDYDIYSGSGELWLFEDGKSKKITDNVSYFIH